MFATGNHDVELFTASLDADPVTIDNCGSLGYVGHKHRLDLPKNGPGKCPSVYSLSYGNVGVISVDANDLSYEIQGLLGYSDGTQLAWLKKNVGSAGRPRYAWSGAVESDRNFIAGVNTNAPGNGNVVPADAATGVGPYASQLDFSDAYETVDWSRARYRDYAFIALDVNPAAPDGTTTMTLRAINEQGVEFDRVIFSRRHTQVRRPWRDARMADRAYPRRRGERVPPKAGGQGFGWQAVGGRGSTQPGAGRPG